MDPSEPATLYANATTAKRGPGRFALWIGVIVVAVAIAFLVGSFVLDGFLRPRLQARMNAALKGYRVTVGHVHFQLSTLGLTLRQVTLRQAAHPAPPVADFPVMRFRIQWSALIHGRVVGNVELWRPRVYINQPQLMAEADSKTPLRQRGWQDALAAAYPFEIDRFAIHDGYIVYIDSERAKPLQIVNVDFVSDNIRNVREPDNVYPSTFTGSMGLFGSGRLKVDGRVNYLMKPYPGMIANYAVAKVPLGAITPATQHVNVIISGGSLASEGVVEYSPRITSVKVQDARIDGVDLTYLHLARTQQAESRRLTTVGKKVQEGNNRPATNIYVKTLEIRRSRLSYKSQDSGSPYILFIDDTNLAITNFSNHVENGPSQLDLTGRFMGSGATHVQGTFVPAATGPEFAGRVAIVNTDLTALNPLLRAEGRIDVVQGSLSVYSQAGVKNNHITGYVKPLFADVEVYNRNKDKNMSVLQQAKRMVVGAAAHLLKNEKTQQVATQVDLDGNLKNPDVSTWQALVQIVQNAFVKAILPGFDREVGPMRQH